MHVFSDIMTEHGYTDRYLKETFAGIYHNHTRYSDGTIGAETQRALNQHLKQDEDFINKVKFTKQGLILTTSKEVIEYLHSPELNMRLVLRKPK